MQKHDGIHVPPPNHNGENYLSSSADSNTIAIFLVESLSLVRRKHLTTFKKYYV